MYVHFGLKHYCLFNPVYGVGSQYFNNFNNSTVTVQLPDIVITVKNRNLCSVTVSTRPINVDTVYRSVGLMDTLMLIKE